MNILEKIIARKRQEIGYQKERISIKELEQYAFFNTATYSLKEKLQDPDNLGVIAEYKRKSPSKGIINAKATVEDVTQGYRNAGAAGLSVLTDLDFFGGNNGFLIAARSLNQIPILRKDFIIDEYQIIEAKAIGASVILLIANCLTKKELEHLAKFAHSLNLEVLMEIHDEEELEKHNKYVDIIGVNNRNLKTFEVSIQQSLDLLPKLPKDIVKISESGISSPEAVATLKTAGFDGFLIGESFMKTQNPGVACRDFINEVNTLIFSTL